MHFKQLRGKATFSGMHSIGQILDFFDRKELQIREYNIQMSQFM